MLNRKFSTNILQLNQVLWRVGDGFSRTARRRENEMLRASFHTHLLELQYKK